MNRSTKQSGSCHNGYHQNCDMSPVCYCACHEKPTLERRFEERFNHAIGYTHERISQTQKSDIKRFFLQEIESAVIEERMRIKKDLEDYRSNQSSELQQAVTDFVLIQLGLSEESDKSVDLCECPSHFEGRKVIRCSQCHKPLPEKTERNNLYEEA